MAKNGEALQEGRDYYMEDGLFVLTADYLLRRGYCCGNGCRHCPYGGPENADSPPAQTSKGRRQGTSS